MNFNGELAFPEVDVFQLSPEKDFDGFSLVQVVVGSEAAVADAQIAGQVAAVQHLVVVGAVRGQPLYFSQKPAKFSCD